MDGDMRLLYCLPYKHGRSESESVSYLLEAEAASREAEIFQVLFLLRLN